jgi:hypothetical protein
MPNFRPNQVAISGMMKPAPSPISEFAPENLARFFMLPLEEESESWLVFSLKFLRRKNSANGVAITRKANSTRTSSCISAEEKPNCVSKNGNVKGSENPMPEKMVDNTKEKENAESLPELGVWSAIVAFTVERKPPSATPAIIPARTRSAGFLVKARMNRTGDRPAALMVSIHFLPFRSESSPSGIPAMTMVIPSAPTTVPINSELIPTSRRYAVTNTKKYEPARVFRDKIKINDLTCLGTPKRKPWRVESKEKLYIVRAERQ